MNPDYDDDKQVDQPIAEQEVPSETYSWQTGLDDVYRNSRQTMKDVLEQTNQERAEIGLEPLTGNSLNDIGTHVSDRITLLDKAAKGDSEAAAILQQMERAGNAHIAKMEGVIHEEEIRNDIQKDKLEHEWRDWEHHKKDMARDAASNAEAEKQAGKYDEFHNNMERAADHLKEAAEYKEAADELRKK
jgi:hypothetical protein